MEKQNTNMFVPSNLTQEEGILKSYFTTEIFVFVYFKPSIDMEVQNIWYKKYYSQKKGPNVLVLLEEKVYGHLLKREDFPTCYCKNFIIV